MLIDWFTVAAQIVNFLVLVLLLRRFLYGRLLKAIDDRETRLAARLAEAEQKNKEAERWTEQVRAQAAEMEYKRAETIAEAQFEADQRRAEMIQQARDSVRAMESRWRQDLEREKTAFLDEVRRRTGSEILAIARRALADLACCDLQHCAIQAFLEKLPSLDAGKLAELKGDELTVVSAVDLPEETRRQVQQALEAKLGAPLRVRFARAPAMAWGIELRGNGRRLGWNSDSYLESLEQNLKEALERREETAYRTLVG